MFSSQKNVFWQALIFTIFIFALGMIAGVVLENWRTSKIDFLFQKSEIDLLDAKIQNQIYTENNFDCSSAIDENMKFADRIYGEAKMLEKYEGASRLTEDLYLEHKKYDLLRTLLLLNSIKLKEKCNVTYDEVVYFYNFNEENIEKKIRQGVFSNQLREIKELKGSSVLLIPIAANMNVSSIELVLQMYQVDKQNLPLIVINRNKKVDSLMDTQQMLSYLRQ